MADDDKKGRLLLTNRIMKPVERRAIANLQKQVKKIDYLIDGEIASFGDADRLNDDVFDTKELNQKTRKTISALRKQMNEKQAAIKSIEAGALAKGKASPPNKTVLRAIQSRPTSLLTSKDASKNVGGAPRGFMVAINKWKDLFS